MSCRTFSHRNLVRTPPLVCCDGSAGSSVRISEAMFALLFCLVPLAFTNFQANGPQKYSATTTIRARAAAFFGLAARSRRSWLVTLFRLTALASYACTTMAAQHVPAPVLSAYLGGLIGIIGTVHKNRQSQLAPQGVVVIAQGLQAYVAQPQRP